MDSSRIGLFGQGCVVMILAACAGCSSSSSPVAPSEAGTGSSSGGSSGGSGSDASPVVDGSGPACTKTYPLSVGTLISLNVKWPGTAAVSAGGGLFYLWLLTTYSADTSGKITGTVATCGNTPPDITLSATGNAAEGVPMGQVGQVQAHYPADSWTGVPTTAITGTLGGTNTGSSFEIDPSVTLNGLIPTDPLSDPTKKWPASNTALTQTDLTYADGGAYVTGTGHPGIRGVFTGTAPYYLATTSLSADSPRADQFWSVTRTRLGLYGTSSSCTETKGAANVTLINNRVVGCEVANDGGPCTQDQFGFIDSNTTQYGPGAGTFDSKELATGATCADVLSMLTVP